MDVLVLDGRFLSKGRNILKSVLAASFASFIRNFLEEQWKILRGYCLILIKQATGCP